MNANLGPGALAIGIDVDPTMVDIGAFVLTWPGFFIGVAVVVGLILGIRLAARDGIPVEVGQELALVGIPAGVVGARLMYVIEHWGDFWTNDIAGMVFGITDGGMTLLGGLIGGVIGAVLYARYRGWPIAIPLDAAAPALILAITIGRFGDLLSGERTGTASDLPWAVRYEHADTLGSLGISVHPTAGGYELLGAAAIFALVMFVLRPRVRVVGWVFCTFAILYAVLRFALAPLRADEATVGDLAVTQLVSAIIAGAAILLAGLFYRRPDNTTPEWESRVLHTPPPEPAPPPRRRKRARA